MIEIKDPGTGTPGLDLLAVVNRISTADAWPMVGGDPDDPDAITATEIVSTDPAGLARAIATVFDSQRDEHENGTEAKAEAIANTLERLAEIALEDHIKTREEILVAVGRAMVGSESSLHDLLFMEKSGTRSVRKQLVAAVEALPSDAVAELVCIHFPKAKGDFVGLTELVNRTQTWRLNKDHTVDAVQRRLIETGVKEKRARDIVDQLLWSEVTLSRRLELLTVDNALWRTDFSRIKDALVKLFAADRTREANELVMQYLDGLVTHDAVVRHHVADNSRYLLQLIEKTPKARTMVSKIADLFFTRLQEEDDDEIAARLAGGLAFLCDLRLRSGGLVEALDLMRKAERLAGSDKEDLKARGEKLSESLSRAGNEKTFKSLCEMLLEGSDRSSLEAAEILKRGGSRSASYLIDRLAEEDNRARRARLVLLLKEMGKGASAPFVKRLNDGRWYLVRNVVGILGDIGDATIVSHLKQVATHPEPRVRQEVVRTYMRLGTPECQELIIESLADNDRGVQLSAVKSLASLDGQRPVRVLKDIARKIGPYSNVAAEVRQEAVLAIGELGAEGTFDILHQILTKRGFLGLSEPTDVRAAAVKALAALKIPKAYTLLNEIARKDPRQSVRDLAQKAAKQRGVVAKAGVD